MIISQQQLECGVAGPSGAMSPPNPWTQSLWGLPVAPASRRWDYHVTPQLTSWA